MTHINEIAFIDDDGFDFNDGEKLIRFDNVTYYRCISQRACQRHGKIVLKIFIYIVLELDSNWVRLFFLFV